MTSIFNAERDQQIKYVARMIRRMLAEDATAERLDDLTRLYAHAHVPAGHDHHEVEDLIEELEALAKRCHAAKRKLRKARDQ